MSIGQNIRKYRQLRNLTQKSLSERAGMTESAVRMYELDLRTPNQEMLEKIANALDVRAEALEDYEINTAREALEALFRLEEAFGLTPTEEDTLSFNPKAEGSQKLAQAIKAWRGVLDEVEAGEMSAEDYELWKGSTK